MSRLLSNRRGQTTERKEEAEGQGGPFYNKEKSLRRDCTERVSSFPRKLGSHGKGQTLNW